MYAKTEEEQWWNRSGVRLISFIVDFLGASVQLEELHKKYIKKPNEKFDYIEIVALNEAIGDQFEKPLETWELIVVEGIPRQSNYIDCGVYVMKYFETLVKCGEIDWDPCIVDWAKNMPKFRAEIAYEILFELNSTRK
ncbi:hypothetical protein KSP40_PGU013954 [Platanthera guangdongensis]|uniref:Ubiquitin-like protease family profile domain-containing protein n=1 Tax=Platanthera guangdongensis TaxID=2320717 RepID=A0ABR2LVE5_9ASPA